MIQSRIARFSRTLLFVVPGLLAALAFIGCGGTNITTSAAPTVTIAASPASIASGASSTLTIAVTGATSVTVSGTDGSSYNMATTGGTQAVSPASTTTYTATAVGNGGKTSATATVTVTGTTTPAPTVTISASPTSIAAGASSTLTVAATNATSVTISGTDGSSYTLAATGGTQAVSPKATTTYTATATGAGGTITATAAVTVTSGTNPAPTVTIAANPTSITAGASSTLTVAATNATSVTISGTDGSSYTLAATGGTQAVSPKATTTYTATATGTGGTITATATVTVTAATGPAPTVTIAASPTSITPGASSTLTVVATNATTVTIAGTDSSSYSLAAIGGTQMVSPKATTTYTVTANGAGGSVTATATVTVAANPAPTVSITANPTAITAGASSALSVTATNATTVTITGSDKTSYNLTATGGIQAVAPTTTTTYTATAVGPGGTTSATATVTVTPNPAPTVTITANPPSITAGATSSLTVNATYANSVTLTGSDGTTYSNSMTATGGGVGVTPATTTTYTATATGPGGTTTATVTVTVTPNPAPSVTITANPTKIVSGNSSTLTVTAANATTVTITGTDGSSYNLADTGGTQSVSPTATTSYTATATGAGGNATAATTVTVNPPGSVQQINHVVFMLQENHTFDNYMGKLNSYRAANNFTTGADGVTYTVDGIEKESNGSWSIRTDLPSSPENTNTYDATTYNPNGNYSIAPFPLISSCVDDMSSDFLSSYGDVNRYDFGANRTVPMNGFVHDASGYAGSCGGTGSAPCPPATNGVGATTPFDDQSGQRAMGYYDGSSLNYYYYMASQFAVSDRWFSPMSDKSIDNRIATFSGGTTGGLVLDPGGQDHLPQLTLNNIFKELDKYKVSWKIYYTVTEGFCIADDDCGTSGAATSFLPATDFGSFSYSFNFMFIPTDGNGNQVTATAANCTAQSSNPNIVPSSQAPGVHDTGSHYCVDPTHIAPLSQYFTDAGNQTLPSFGFIEAGYSNNDEHPGYQQSILYGQSQVAKVVNGLMGSQSWGDSAFFFSYDEGGGPFEHVPPVPTHTNDYTPSAIVANYTTDISSIAVNPYASSSSSYAENFPCVPTSIDPTTRQPTPANCDLPASGWPGDSANDAVSQQGFAAQLGFRVPNFVVSPFTRAHYVSHIPMDHTAVIKFVENRFIGPNANLTQRDAAQPNLLDFFDFDNIPWAAPPTPPTPTARPSSGPMSCQPDNIGAPHAIQ